MNTRTSVRDSASHRYRRNFILAAVGLLLVVTSCITWFAVTRVVFGRAHDQLRHVASELRDDIDGSVDAMLTFVGNAICRHYKYPNAIGDAEVQEVLRRYDIDELNVVDANGIVRTSSIGIAGRNFWGSERLREFNVELLQRGERSYCQAFRESVSEKGVFRKYVGVAFESEPGYVQLGFDMSRMNNDVDYWFRSVCVDWSIGDRGYFLCMSEDGRTLMSCGSRNFNRKVDTPESIGVDVSRLPPDRGTVFEMELYGEACLCVSEVCMHHRIMAAIPLSEIRYQRTLTMMSALTMLIIGFAVFAYVIVRMTGLLERLDASVAAERARQEADLALARTIQVSSLPMVFPDNDRFRISAYMKPAREVGGDFFDFYCLPSGRLFFLIADVSGKGIPAAMFMMKAKSVIKASAFTSADFADAAAAANERLCEGNEADMFVTAWMGLFDPESGRVDFVSAGHNPPLIRCADGTTKWVKDRPSLALAAMPGVPYRVHSLQLKPGDRLFLYTDGVTEAINLSKELFGEPRLERCIAASGADCIAEVRRELDRFVGAAEQFDDITMLVLERKS